MKILGLKSDGNSYVPTTSQLIDENTENGRNVLAGFIDSQVLTFPETIIASNDITNYKYKKFYYDVEMRRKIHDIREYAERYNCIVDVSHSYEYRLKKDIDNRDLNDIVIGAVCSAMDKGSAINLENIGIDLSALPRNLRGLLENYQAFMGQSLSLDRGSRLESLSMMRDSADQIRRECDEKIRRLNGELDVLRSRNDSLEQQNFHLSEEVKGYAKKLSLIRQVVTDTGE